MAACVTNPTRTVYSTPVNVQTVTQTITTTITHPGAEVTQTFYSTSCLPYNDVIFRRYIRPPSAKFIRQVECPNGTTVYTSYSTSSDPPTYITPTEFNTNYVTNFGDPVAVGTQFDTTNEFHLDILLIDIRSLPDSSTAPSIIDASPTQTPDPVVIGHKSHKTAAIAGGVVAGLLCLAIVAGAVFYFKFWKAGGGGKSGHHGHHGGEKTDIGGTTGGGGGGGGGTGVEHAPGHAGHHVPPTNYGGTGIETSGAGAGGGGAGGPAGTAPGGGGGGMDTSAVAGGGYGGTAPPTTGLEGQFHASTLPPGASAPAHHAYPVIVPVGARRREPGQAQQEMVNTLSTPWTDPAQPQSSYYYPQQQQPWQNADPYASATPGAHYPNSGPGWADPAYSSPYSQPGYNNGTPYPADPRMSQQGGYDPRASVGGGTYYPGSAPGHTSPNQNRTSVISSSPSSAAGNPRASLLPYMNDYGAPQPGPSIAGTPAPPTSATESSADPFDKHAEAAAAASASAGPSDHDQPPPSYDEAGPSAQPFVSQDAKGRQ
ncbi:hypothetical protein FRC05_010986 [Tulasnella sp. 425]|nr:hypothetical protein FRC05_010986 [Tulasnella sp. 425]